MSEPAAKLDHDERRAVVWLFVICGVLIATGLVVGIDTRPQVTPVQFGDVTEANVVEIRDQHGVAVLTGEFRSRTDALGNIEKDAALRDASEHRVIGEVEIEIPAKGRPDRRLELEVDIIELTPRATFTVVVDDREVGRFTTDDRGSIDVELREGETGPLPTAGQ